MNSNHAARRSFARSHCLRRRSGLTVHVLSLLQRLWLLPPLVLFICTTSAGDKSPSQLATQATPALPRWFYNGTHVSPLCEVTSRCDTSSREQFVPSCSCHENCSLYDACCEDVRPSDWQFRMLPTNAFECAVYPALGTAANGNFVISNAAFVFLVTGCPSNYTDSCLDRLCDSKSNLGMEGAIRFTWVTDQSTGITYRNKYCAACHGITAEKMVFWRQSRVCTDDIGLSRFGLSGCIHNVLFMETIATALPRCFGPYYFRCSNGSSQQLQEACTNSPARFVYNRANFVTYRNYYCSLCDPSSFSMSLECTPNSIQPAMPFVIGVPLVSGARGCLRDWIACTAEEESAIVNEVCTVSGVARNMHTKITTTASAPIVMLLSVTLVYFH